MKINEVIAESIEVVDEASMDPKIKKIMTKKGYKFLGHGQDQDAYLAPDGTILKIFGYEQDSKGYSRGQQSFIDFANFCMANKGNPFLPQFGGWEPFVLDGQQYLQIKCERLFDTYKAGAPRIGEALELLAARVQHWGAVKGIEKFMYWEVDTRDADSRGAGGLIALLGGEEQLMLLAKTIEQLAKLASKQRYILDLHSGNFMFGSDGEVVINDPFFTGHWR